MNDPYSIPLRLTPELVAELAAWTARNRAARRAYIEQPNAVSAHLYRRVGGVR